MKLLDIVKDNLVHFRYYRDGQFYYETDKGFLFPVPLSDIGTATMKDTDKAILFLRWIKPYFEALCAEQQKTVDEINRLLSTEILDKVGDKLSKGTTSQP